MTGLAVLAVGATGPGQPWWTSIVRFDDYGALLALVRTSLVAGAVLGIVAGVVSMLVMARDLPFAVHGISELSFAGAAGGLLLGANVVLGSLTGSLIAAVVMGLLGTRARERNSSIGVLMPFGLGLGVLFLSLYQGRAANKFGLLTGQIVAVGNPQLAWLIGLSVVVLAVLVLLWRPLTFASLDGEVAAARGLPVRALGLAFMLLLGATVAMTVQIVGALLVLSVVCTPAAAAMRVTSSRPATVMLSVAFAVTAVVGGILVSLGGSVPVSPYVTTISFASYLACRGIGRLRGTGSRGPS